MDIAAFGALCDMEIKQLEIKSMVLLNHMCQVGELKSSNWNEMHAANQSHVSGGRRALAAALSKHEGALMNLLSPFGLEAAEVQARATLHLSCADIKSCD